jgi:hypothetical protein
MFEYLGVLIAVILGLSLTHLLRGLSKLIHMRRTIKPYWVQIVWTVNILIYVLAVWWGMFWWNKLQAWSIEEFFAIAAYCACAIRRVYPDDPRHLRGRPAFQKSARSRSALHRLAVRYGQLCHPDFNRQDWVAYPVTMPVRAMATIARS